MSHLLWSQDLYFMLLKRVRRKPGSRPPFCNPLLQFEIKWIKSPPPSFEVDYVAERGMLKLNPTPASTLIWTQNILQQIIYISEDKLKP